jgi:hypothetical protein
MTIVPGREIISRIKLRGRPCSKQQTITLTCISENIEQNKSRAGHETFSFVCNGESSDVEKKWRHLYAVGHLWVSCSWTSDTRRSRTSTLNLQTETRWSELLVTAWYFFNFTRSVQKVVNWKTCKRLKWIAIWHFNFIWLPTNVFFWEARERTNIHCWGCQATSWSLSAKMISCFLTLPTIFWV